MKDILSSIGSTPLIKIKSSLPADIYVKAELFNPLSSVKDRAAFYMINSAVKEGLLKPGGTIVEPTSGNTGIGLAAFGGFMGFKVILCMPESMSEERKKLLKLLCAELILTPAAEGMKGSIAKAKEVLASTPGAYMPDQFSNKANAFAHFETTGPEIYKDLQGRVDILVAGVGTGGTITGTGRFLKSKNPKVKVVAVEPAESPVLSGGKPGPHKIQGIGAGFVPSLLDLSLIDEILPVSGEDAFKAARKLRLEDALFCGISSGAAYRAAEVLAARPENKGLNIVLIAPDGGERYLSLL